MPTGKRMSLIDAVSAAANEIGIAQRAVSQVIASPDQDISQMAALLHAVAAEVLEEEPYNVILGDGLWVVDAETGVFKDKFDSDSDLIAFDGRLAVNGIIWRFLKGKSLEFGEQQRDFTTRLAKIAARANARVLDLDLDWSRVQ